MAGTRLNRTDVFFLALAASSLLLVLGVWLASLGGPATLGTTGGGGFAHALQLAQSLNKASVGSFLSIGSVGSIASIGSTGSILSIGSAGSVLSIASVGGVGTAFAILGIFSFGGFNLVCSRDWPYGIGQLFRCMRGAKKRNKHS